MAFCSNCGSQLEAGAAFCQNCGTSVTAGNVPPQTAPGYVQAPPPQAAPGYVQAPPPQIPAGYQQKSKIAAGLLGILLGALGIHNFYLGYTAKAVAQLLLSVLSGGLLIGISGIWGLIEGVMILTGSIAVDENNIPLKD